MTSSRGIDWTEVGFEKFRDRFDAYIKVGPWRKAEEVLGWRAIEEYRRGLSYGNTLAA